MLLYMEFFSPFDKKIAMLNEPHPLKQGLRPVD
jgi:hypothetical protein